MNLLRTIFIAFVILIGCKAKSQKQETNIDMQYQWSFPDTSIKWQPQQLINGIDTLLYYQQTGAYGHLQNHEGYNKLLAKITNIHSYWYLTSNGMLLNDRFKSYFIIYDRVKRLSNFFYAFRQQGKFVYSFEITLLHNFLISLMKVQMELGEAFIATQKNLIEVQQEGLQKVIQGAKIVITGNLIIIEKEYMMYTENEICSQAQSFYTYYQFVRNRLDVLSRNEFDEKVKNIITKHPYKCIRNILL